MRIALADLTCLCVVSTFTMANLKLLALVSWFISVYYSFERPWKPFNPILGETYEMANHGGITFISEQVSFYNVYSLLKSEITCTLERAVNILLCVTVH